MTEQAHPTEPNTAIPPAGLATSRTVPSGLSNDDPLFYVGAYDDEFAKRVSADAYHRSRRVSRSVLDILANRSRAHAKRRWLHPDPPTPSMLSGRAIHTSVLEPDRFADEWTFPPEGLDRRTKAGKEAWAEFLGWSEAEELEVVGYDPHQRKLFKDDVEAVTGIANALRENEKLQELLQGAGFVECSYAFDWTDPEHGNAVHLKARPDLFGIERDAGNILVDLKSTTDASPAAWQRKCESLRYYTQAAFYEHAIRETIGADIDHHLHVVYERTAPYACAIYLLDSEYIRFGQKEFQKGLDLFSEASRTDDWGDYTAKGLRLLEPSAALRAKYAQP